MLTSFTYIPSRSWFMKTAAILLSLSVSTAVAAQSPASSPPERSPEASALSTCTQLAESGRSAEAEAPGKTAEVLYRRRISQNPRDVEALVGAARALSQCLV